MLIRKNLHIFAVLFRNRMLGSIAQLVQSVCLTSRGSGVRLPLLPRKRLEKSSLFLLYTVEPPALCLAASAAHRRTEFPKETQGGDARNRLRPVSACPGGLSRSDWGIDGKALACQGLGFDSLCSHRKRLEKSSLFVVICSPAVDNRVLQWIM